MDFFCFWNEHPFAQHGLAGLLPSPQEDRAFGSGRDILLAWAGAAFCLLWRSS